MQRPHPFPKSDQQAKDAGSQQSQMWQEPKLLILLASGSLTVMTGAVLAPILPEMIARLGLEEDWAGVLVSAHYLTLALFSPLLGFLADRLGQLRLLVLSLVLYSVLGMAGALLPTFGWLLLDRALLGIATSGIAAGSLGLLTKEYEAEARTQAIAYISVVLTLANIVYPLLSGGIGVLHWGLAFIVYGLGLPIALGAVMVFKPNVLHSRNHFSKARSLLNVKTKQHSPSQALGFRAVFQQPAIPRLLLSLVIVSAAVFGMVVYLPLYLQLRLGTDVGINGIVLATMAIGSALSSLLLLKWLTHHLGIFRTLPLGLGLMALLLILTPTLEQLSLVLLTAMGFGVGFGVVTPSLYNGLANLTPNNLQSSVLATGIGAGFLGQFLSPLILGRVLALTHITGVFYAAAVAVLGTGIMLVLPPKPTS
jgi:predicted MFS family arabinose efflux permease